MIYTTQDIKNLHLKIWLDKSPMERLHEFIPDNEALIKFWNEVQPSNKKSKVISSNYTIDNSKNINSSKIN